MSYTTTPQDKTGGGFLSRLGATALPAVAAIAVSLMATGTSAHTVGLGWLDNGDGTVTLFGEHWHGDQSAPSTANGGLGIFDNSTGSELFRTAWIGVFNNVDETSSSFGKAGLGSSALTGFAADPGNHDGSSPYNDWLYTTPLTLGNGTWDFFTGTSCCIDTMTQKLTVTLTGIVSVPPGTGPGPTSPVPLPAAGWMLLAGIGGLAAMKRRKKATA